MITFILTLLAYLFSRTKHYRWGSILLTTALSMTAFLTVIGGTETPSSTLYSSLPISLLLAFALFSLRGLAITLVLNVIGIILLPFSVSYVQPSDIMSAAGIISTFGLLLIIVGFVRNAIEDARLAELSQTNQALEFLRANLETQVEERSRTLAEALRITRLGNWEYNLQKDEFTFNDDFYTMMRTTIEREGSYIMSAAGYAQRFVYPEDAPLVGMEIGMAVASTDPNYSRELSHRVIFGDGELGYITVRFRIERDTQGRPIKFFGANQDVTEQKLAEIALVKNEAQLSEALTIARLGNWEYDFLKDEFTFNDEFYAMMRTSAEQVGGYKMNAADYAQRFVYPEDAPIVGEEIGKSVVTTDPNFSTEIDHRVIFGDGELGYITVRFRIQKDAQGRTIKSFGANQDITAKKKAEIELRKFRLALERSTDAVFMTNLEGKIEYVNPAFETTYGFSPEETIGNTPRIIKSGLIPQEQYVHFWDELLHNQVITGELINKHKDGRLLPIEAINTSILDTSGNQLGFMATHRDITARKKAEETLAKRAAELETVTQVATAISTISNPQEMLQFVSNLTKERFGFYHAHVYLLDEEDSMLELAAGAGEPGAMMVARGHSIPLTREQSLVARAARTREGVLVNDVTLAPDFLPNPLLPETRSEVAVPLLIRDRVLGVLDVQSADVNAFTQEDIRIQTILAAQIAVALENARANEKSVKALTELDTLTRRLTHQGWQTYLNETDRERIGYIYEGNRVNPLYEKETALEQISSTVVQPVILRGERIGQLSVAEPKMAPEEIQPVLSAISQGLSAHLENLRLTEESERRVDELRLVNEIGQALTAEVELLPILVTVVNTIHQAMQANYVYIALYNDATHMIEIPYMLDHDTPIFEEPAFPLGQGITSNIIKTRRRIFINQDTEQSLLEMGALPMNTHSGMAKSFIGIPLVAGETVIGVLSVQDLEREGRFSQNDVDLLTTIAANVAVAIQNARLYADAHKRAQRETMVNQIGQKIQSATTVQSALQIAVQELGLALRARRTAIQLKSFASEEENSEKAPQDTGTLLSLEQEAL
ncbi:MAG TPA: GAF domain-containing protein [Anaerolineales bacterium]|nr:GAF domain-containing protein [Anaerolineales bacterium]